MDWTPDADALRGRVAVVAGATRGAGRGIAAALGEAGATVICTGRSSVAGNAESDYDRPETIEETAELVTSLGGVGIPIQVDHLDIAQVRALADRIRDDHGAIDILVNDIWGAEVLKGHPPTWNRPIWEHDLDDGLRILRLGIDTHLITAHSLLPLLVMRPGGLHVEVTDGTKEYNDRHLPDLGLLRLVKGRGEQARLQHRPRTRAVRRHRRRCHAGLAALGDDARQLGRHGGQLAHRAGPRSLRRLPPLPRDSPYRRSPRYVGRGVAAIAADENRSRWNQRSVTSAELAREYGFTDIDGHQPDGWAEV